MTEERQEPACGPNEVAPVRESPGVVNGGVRPRDASEETDPAILAVWRERRERVRPIYLRPTTDRFEGREAPGIMHELVIEYGNSRNVLSLNRNELDALAAALDDYRATLRT